MLDKVLNAPSETIRFCKDIWRENSWKSVTSWCANSDDAFNHIFWCSLSLNNSPRKLAKFSQVHYFFSIIISMMISPYVFVPLYVSWALKYIKYICLNKFTFERNERRYLLTSFSRSVISIYGNLLKAGQPSWHIAYISHESLHWKDETDHTKEPRTFNLGI